MTDFAPLPDPPYYAVIFTAQLTHSTDVYDAMAGRMDTLAAQQPGYIGAENARNDNGFGITVSYWSDEDSLRNWKQVAEHIAAQDMGKKRWYSNYTLRVALVERQYQGPAGRK